MAVALPRPGRQRRIKAACALSLLTLLVLFLLFCRPAQAARVTGDDTPQAARPAPAGAPPPASIPDAAPPTPANPAAEMSQGDNSTEPRPAEPGPPPGRKLDAKDFFNVKDKAEPAPKTEAAPKKASAEEEKRLYNIDFNDVDLDKFVKTMSEITKKNFVIDSKVKGKVTIVSPTKVTEEEAYRVFQAVLEVQGFAAIPSGEVIKIVPSVEAKQRDVPTRISTKPEIREDKVITQIVPLKYASPNEIKKIFQPLVSKSSIILSYDPTNTLIITDFQSNVQRLLHILNVIDVPGTGQEITVLPLENAVASEVVKILTTLFQKRSAPSSKAMAGGSDSIKLVSDDRTNSLIILASEADTEAVKKLANMLDKEMPRGKGRIRVYYLQNATAEDVAKVLTGLQAQKPGEAAKKGEAPVISKDVVISADKATNSLIITAAHDDYLILEDVIQKLDIQRAMVYIEALIMEVSTRKNFELGVEWRAGSDFELRGGQGVYFGGSGGGGTNGAYQIFPTPTVTTAGQVVANFPTAFSLGVVGENIKVGDVIFPNIGAVLRAYRNDSDVHILSAPQVLTVNNEEATITVGKNVPYVTRQETSTANVDYSTYEYKDVGVTLKITPQISQERLVRLKIFQEVTRLIETGQVDRPTTYKRSTQTTVSVKDRNTVVIGGLIDQSTDGGSYKVPCLGDIPGLGYLFKSMYENRERTNLYVFITPHIVEYPEEMRPLTDKKKNEIKQIENEAVKLYQRRGDLNLSFDAMTYEGTEPEAGPYTQGFRAPQGLPPVNVGPDENPEDAEAGTIEAEEKELKKEEQKEQRKEQKLKLSGVGHEGGASGETSISEEPVRSEEVQVQPEPAEAPQPAVPMEAPEPSGDSEQ
ncbi:MAG: type II secretion system secretin GspD [Thermodesulfobacteriota bacterium]